MKPNLRLVKTYWDCGWKYELWYCHIGLTGCYANTPKDAYEGCLRSIERIKCHQTLCL